MRGPPPAWMPPHPPDRDHDYENNYEDPEDCRERELSSRDLLLTSTTAPPKYNSYEMSLSQQRRSAMREPLAPTLDDWSSLAEGQTILHKNADGAYYIPSGSVRTTTSTLSPASQTRYTDQCRTARSSDTTAALIKYPTTASILQHPKRRTSLKKPLESMKPAYPTRRPSPCSLFLGGALLVALVIIILLLLRNPSYVYAQLTPFSTTDSRISVDEKSLRPLPSVISLGQRVEADILPQHMTNTELFITRAGRIAFNVTVGPGAQMVLMGRHAVPPSLSLHDFYHPLRADRLTPPSPSHSIETARHKRQTSETLATRYAVFEHFLVDGRWYLTVVNERNRVEPINFLAYSIATPASSSADGTNPLAVRCDADCNGHGECLSSGRCKCAPGFMGEACEESVCPVVCSGNGVFSGGACVCRTGFKGKECDVHAHWCEVPDCSGHGRCGDEGVCQCEKGWTGEGCELRACSHPTCSDHGVCMNGQCYCADGWRGKECAEQITEPTVATVPATVVAALVPMVEVLPSPSEKPRQISRELERQKLPKPSKMILQPPKCNDHGKYVVDTCRCDRGWEGKDCEREVCPPCEHGLCRSGLCICEAGWTGNLCDHADCAIGCLDHGKCMKNGTCLCDKGWNGGNCHIEGCPLSCSGHGECRWGLLPGEDGDGWRCDCQPSFIGDDCAVPVETDCQDGLDNDNDGLIDCDDPECCSSTECSREAVCAAVPTPVDVLLRLPAVQNANFFQRVSFIIRNDSVQSYSDKSQFNESMISVIRGRVVWNGGANGDSKSTVALPGVRVSDAANPLYGFTLSRLDGEFDLLVNGGRTVNLQFLRSPFQRLKRSVYVPPNEIVVVEPIKMARERQRELSARPECSVANRVLPVPVLRPEWSVSTDGIPSSSIAPTLLVDTRSIVQRVTASQSTLVLGLLPNKVDPDLRLVHVIVKISGRTFEKSLAPRENLTYVWSWDKLNVYRQSDHGMIPADVKIGYEYRGCGRPSEVTWISRRVFMEGARARRLEGGGWSVDIHHHLDVVNGVLEMGNGGRRFIANSMPMVELFAGSGKRRQLECQNCNGPIGEADLFRPSALAHGLDGCVFIGDHNHVRRVGPDGQITTVLSLSLPDTSYPYYLAVSPVDGFLVISLPLHKQIWKVISHFPLDPTANHEVLAGDGTACPAAADSCGDGGPATDAQLFFPKGLSFDAQGNLYVTDGRRLRVIDIHGNIRSLGDTSFDRAPSCDRSVFSLARLQLEWPTSLSVHLLTGQIFVLDSNIVYQLDRAQDTAEIVVGALTTCQNASSRHIVRNARDIAAATDGSLYVIESDGKKMNQIRRLSADRTSFPVIAGRKTACACDVVACGCDDAASPTSVISVKMALFSSPSAVSVDALGRVYVADAVNAKVKRITPRTARYDSIARQYSVVDVDRNELYSFNRYGLHTSTQSLITGAVLYNFTYNVDTSLGRLSSIHGAGGYQLRFIRANESHCTIETPSGQRTVLVTSIYDGVIESVQTGIGEPIRLNYLPGGLLISQSQGGAVTVYEYNDKGRVTAMRNDGKEFRIVDEKVLGGWVTTNVLRNGDPYATFTSRTSEVAFDDSSSSRIIYMDDGFSVLHGGMTSLLDANTHPVHGESSVLKIKTTIDALQNPSRRSLTSRFDWRPFVKRGGAERRVAEVNGVNVFTVTFDRVTKSDVISAKSEDETLHLMYMDSGELRQIVQEAPMDIDVVYRLANLTINYDSLGRRNELIWGNRSVQVTYDRQNRVVERTTSDFVSTKFAYHKDLRHPSMIELPGGSRYTLKYDTHGRLREVATPSGESHYFAATPFGSGRVLKRRIPFTKKPFVAAEDLDGRLLEWTTADELHHVLLQRDKYDRVVEEMCDSGVTIFTYKADKLATVNSAHLEVNLTYQGPLLVTLSERRQARNGFRWLDSSFAVEHDELLRPTSIQAVISGTAVEPLLLTYNERTAFMSAYAGYQILRESTMIRIQGFKMMHETSLDIYRQPVSLKIVIGDVRISLMIIRDSVGRSIANAWRTIAGDFKETRSFDAQGRLAGHEMNGKERWLFKYNNDSRLMLMNDVTYEWHAGGVPKKAGRVEYVVDGNGWTIKRGDVSFEMDGYGRVVGARGPSIDMKFDYDYQNRLISITNGATLYSLFYVLPHLPRRVSHFQSSSDSSPTSILHTEEGIPFAMNCDGYRYAIAVDDDGSLRYVLSESGIEKEIHRDPLGRVISDTKTAFWIPLGFRGGVEIPQLSVVIMPNARPYDTLIGRYMSFGPDFIERVRFEDIAPSVDPFALGALETAPLIPTDLATWFRLAGLSPSLLPPADLHLNCRQHVCARSIASFPSRLRTFSQVPSLASSDLLDATFTAMYPSEDVSFTVEDSGFHELLVLTQNGQKTNVQSLPVLTANESALIKSVIEPAHETGWRVFGTSWERHLVRPDAIPDSLTSASFPHSTLVVFRNTAEFRNGKTKIFVHFASDAKTVNKELVEDFRRKEGPAVWRAERRRMERGESKQQWTEKEKRELLSKGAVAGYTIEMDESLRARFSSVHIWRFVKSD
nr:EGF and NHL repeat and YD repeat domain containing protein [Haemonchus contortus]